MISCLATDTSGSVVPRSPRRVLQTAAAGRPILLLQGFGSTNRVMLPLGRRLRHALARPIAGLDSSTHTFEDIRVSARAANTLVETLANRPGFEFVDVVGHSMGGLVAAYLLKHLDRGRRVRRVVTLGTPHRGTRTALAGAALVGFASRAIWQMIPGAPLLRELAAAPVPMGSELISIGAESDRIVPQGRTLLDPSTGQRNVGIPRSSHLELLVSAEVCGIVAATLSAPHGASVGYELELPPITTLPAA
jgi:pimeloyl-ACP methyl ester carboxylesterase